MYDNMRRFAKAAIALGVIIALAAVLGVGIAIKDQKPVKTASVAATELSPPTRAELLRLVNEQRAKVGVKPLVESPLLDQSAQWKADDEIRYSYFGHVKPGTIGNDGLDYLESIGSPCGAGNVSENLSRENYPPYTAQAAVTGWVHSKLHYQAMINPRYTLTGFGIADNQLVEHFCSPDRFTTATTVPDTRN